MDIFEEKKRRIKLAIEYDGSNYAGWQKQKNARSVQGEIERALAELFSQEITIHGAGRTDAGVDALMQIAHFDILNSIQANSIKLALNTKLCKDIRIIQSEQVPDDFHARYDAKGKHYCYSILNRQIPSAIHANHTFHVKEILDVEKMKKASQSFIGTHDFSAFCSAGTDVLNKVRTIHSFEVIKQDDMIFLDIEGNGFLYNMVRIIAGTLIDIGKKKKPVCCIDEIIKSKDRKKASPKAYANGLCLVKVLYDN